MHWLLRYGLALALFGTTIGLAILLSRIDLKLSLTIPIVIAVFATAWWGGRGPGVLISVLFQGTTIWYAKPDPNEALWKVWFGYLSVFALYIFLILVFTHLKRAHAKLREQRDLLRVTLSSIGDGVIATDARGKVTFMNPAARELTGHTDDPKGADLQEVFRIVDETTGEKIVNPVERVLATGTTVGVSNHTMLLANDGRQIPIDDTAAPIKHGDELKGVVLVFSDVTERKEAERSRRESEIMHCIVEAQEGERRRIARDLHDHLGQRMTALRLQVGTLAATRDPSLAKTIDEVQRSASAIDRDIGFLSWELRPTELEYLGLENALLTFVREWSTQYGIAAEFSSTGMEENSAGPVRFSPPIETNLYRIVQEALNNVLKHADATKVNILLQRKRDVIMLIIEDDGKGFTADEPGTVEAPGGLGLAGMRERAALLKGTLEIDSSPESGTTILLKIPREIELPTLKR